jgi:hypothetical protein
VIDGLTLLVRVGESPYEVTFLDADALGARGVVRRLARPDDERDSIYAYVSWAGGGLIVVVQDAERAQHDVRTVDMRWVYPRFDFSPLDDAANATQAAEHVAAAAASAFGF